MSLVSVIVPVYNVEKVLHHCLDSILAQTYQDYELILIDDGSKDGSGGICDAYTAIDYHVTVVHIENQGVSHARNCGIEFARGEFILFIDSDDYVEVDYLRKLMNLQRDHPGCDNIWCGFRTVDSYDFPVATQTVVYTEKEPVTMTSRKKIMTLHEKWLDAGPVCKLYRRGVIEANTIRFDPGISLGEDLLFNFSYLNNTNGSIAILNETLYNYMKTGFGTLSGKYYINLFEIYKHNNAMIYDFLLKWQCDGSQIGSFFNSCYFSYERTLRNTFSCDSQIQHKYRYNKMILKSREFKEALKRSDCRIHPAYRLAYFCRSPRFVRLLDVLYSARNR